MLNVKHFNYQESVSASYRHVIQCCITTFIFKNLLTMTFNFNLLQVMSSSPSQSEWALTLLSYREGLSPSILSSLPDDGRALGDSAHQRLWRGRPAKRENTIWQPNLVCLGFLLKCVCVSLCRANANSSS